MALLQSPSGVREGHNRVGSIVLSDDGRRNGYRKGVFTQNERIAKVCFNFQVVNITA
jgi:hypothetical protein